MHAKVFSATVLGIDSCLIEVEVDLSMGLINFLIVGLPDKAVKESKERVRAALKNCGLKMPERVVTVNLAPAHIKKQDTLFDVPIAVAILQAAKQLDLPEGFLDETVFLGELALDGQIRKVNGVISIAHKAAQEGKKRIIVPQDNVQEALAIEGVKVYGVSNLTELVNFLRGQEKLRPAKRINDFDQAQAVIDGVDFSQVRGQAEAKRAIEVSAAGWHNLLFIGPPGAGKTMLAERLSTIMPEMSFEESVESTKIYSVAGMLDGSGLLKRRPFRSPHHTISQAGLVGGGCVPKPGQISLSQNGVLFLDELTEFSRSAIESLRQPLEGGKVTIARANFSVDYPAEFLLLAATNPCPCGFFGDSLNQCRCSEQSVAKYLGKLSGPLLDRIDLHVRVNAVKYDQLAGESGSENEGSEKIRERVLAAQEFSKQRQGGLFNSRLSVDQVKELCVMSADAQALMKKAFERLSMSARSYHRVLRVSRTIADLSKSEKIEKSHIREAIMLRLLDKQKMAG